MKAPEPEELTAALQSLRNGDERALEEILPFVYSELRRLARSQLARERAQHTLQPTALVHELYVKLMAGGETAWQNRAHFFGAAARAMRQILVDHARRRSAEKRGGGVERLTLQEDLISAGGADELDLLEIHEVLEKFAAVEPDLARMVELRFFGGLTLDETAEVVGLSRRKVAKDWAYARVWLARELS